MCVCLGSQQEFFMDKVTAGEEGHYTLGLCVQEMSLKKPHRGRKEFSFLSSRSDSWRAARCVCLLLVVQSSYNKMPAFRANVISRKPWGVQELLFPNGDRFGWREFCILHYFSFKYPFSSKHNSSQLPIFITWSNSSDLRIWATSNNLFLHLAKMESKMRN